jgi:predicted flap endonuclease-1-like 5' DNA nuclease
MSSISQLEVADEAHELRDDEFTLDAEEVSPQEPTVIRQRLPGRPPPPPPPRRPKPALGAEFPVRSHMPPAAAPLAPSAGPARASGRRISGVYTVDERTGLHTSVLPARTLAEATFEITRLRAQMRARDAYLAELERVVADYRQQLTAAGLDNFDDLARLAGRVRGQAFRIAELESELRRAQASQPSPVSEVASVAGTPGARLERLRRVRGIGRRYAEQLLTLGIDSVEQIARWTEQDCARVAGQLRVSATRVKLWIEQARALASGSAETPAQAVSEGVRAAAPGAE